MTPVMVLALRTGGEIAVFKDGAGTLGFMGYVQTHGRKRRDPIVLREADIAWARMQYEAFLDRIRAATAKSLGVAP